MIIIEAVMLILQEGIPNFQPYHKRHLLPPHKSAYYSSLPRQQIEPPSICHSYVAIYESQGFIHSYKGWYETAYTTVITDGICVEFTCVAQYREFKNQYPVKLMKSASLIGDAEEVHYNIIEAFEAASSICIEAGYNSEYAMKPQG